MRASCTNVLKRRYRTIGISALAFGSLLFLGAGCTLKFSSQNVPGIFKSSDRGVSWSAKSLQVSGTGKKSRLSDIEVRSIAVDPRNSNLVYIGTDSHGVFASETAGESWTQIIPNQRIVSLAFDYGSRCVLYALTPKQLFKTSDCATSWYIILDETRADTDLTSMAVDSLYPHILYVTTNAGDIFQSDDRGTTWKALRRFSQTSLRIILVDRFNPSIIYAASAAGDIYRSENKGATWKSISDALYRDFPKRDVYRGLQMLGRQNSLIFASRSSLYRTLNAGRTWEKLSLLTTDDDTAIFALAVNPENDFEIYYTTQHTFFRSSDGGKTWHTQPLPPQRAGSAISIDTNNSSILYLGLRAPLKKSRFFHTPEEDFY
ncbi:hypothetical protein HYV71_03935 [Candidatus Uhrbacteria bacterium]|nr:hypothetical protein [Candidatus Uhrbacteria bacterium]